MFITFDDGPIPEVTPWVLDVLDDYNAKATFFCVGDNAQRNRPILEKVMEKGHAIGNHTFHHVNGWKTASKDYIEEVALAQDILKTELFRPPHGALRFSAKETIRQNYKIIMWDILSRDYDNSISKEECLQNVINHAKNGSIIVFHDSLKAQKNMRYAMPRTLSYFAKQGFTFERLDKYLINK